MNNQIPNIPLLFEAIKQTEADGAVYWKARDLSKVLGYAEFRNFSPVLLLLTVR